MIQSLKYPVGIQTFSKIIREGYVYVDKTAYLPSLVNGGGYYFLSRPRRFGKSLLLSTLHAYFEGHRDLFKGLALDSADVDWTPSPVIHFDFNSENFTESGASERLLDACLREYEERYGYDSRDVSPAQRFRTLIRKAHEATGHKVVILVDEYDKPLLGAEEKPEVYDSNQSLLKGFFGNLKTMDRYIRFGLLTGVARFNKVSIFSDLNNLHDISLTEEYADICGWTEDELLVNFRSGIEALAVKREESYDDIVRTLRNFYDGYIFAPGGNRLYNPFSVLLALRSKEIEPYWFESATPTFLARRVRSSGIVLPDLNREKRFRDELVSIGIDSKDPVPVMFQTGYLTIKDYDPRRQRYTLGFPNREVEIGFAKSLYPLYVPQPNAGSGPFSLIRFQDDLYDGLPDDFMKRLQTLLKDMPYEQHSEATYHSIVWMLGTVCGTDISSESHSYQGRSDLEIFTPDNIYIFEFKFNGTAEAAMAQIHDRDYAGRYALDNRKIFLIGANFSIGRGSKGLTGWVIEEYR